VKWLLAAIDRTGDHDVPLTQEQLAGMMGVGRSYVSRVIQTLKRRHLLETRRGGGRGVDNERLGALSCGCNDALRRHFEQVLAGVYPRIEDSSALKAEAGSSQPGSRMRA
jgi:DNA-binding transcriptional regulator YhcF (GntR family)